MHMHAQSTELFLKLYRTLCTLLLCSALAPFFGFFCFISLCTSYLSKASPVVQSSIYRLMDSFVGSFGLCMCASSHLVGLCTCASVSSRRVVHVCEFSSRRVVHVCKCLIS